MLFKGERHMQFIQVFDNSSSLILYREGSSCEFFKGEDAFVSIMDAWQRMTEDALPMPAYAVSIDKLTRADITAGEWVEFVFEGVCVYNEMPFERLLVKASKDYCGFNIIRYTSSTGYEGRCFYLQLNEKTMEDFCSEISRVQFK